MFFVMSCFGGFYDKGNPCDTCRVVSSCKRESSKRLKEERKRVYGQKYAIFKFGHLKTKKILLILIRKYSCVSTYRLARDFKKLYGAGVGDVTVKGLCDELRAEGLVGLKVVDGARYWVFRA